MVDSSPSAEQAAKKAFWITMAAALAFVVAVLILIL
jgi:NADH:ubiquinone oxidoreductase subunit 5 (subunit L)/multisubunit Na+/H+ antiporter MnhA subunit